LLFALLRGDAWQRSFEADLFPDPVVFATSSPYQRIVVTRSRGGETRLFLNGHLQFSSTDEYRYHEALVHPALAAAPPGRPLSALVLGGGDGMAVRELLTDPDVKAVHLVDLDGEMTDLFRDHSDLAPLNGLALSDPRVTIENADAFAWVNQHADRRYDVVIVDFPDPSSYGVGKLYTTTFYARLARLLTPDSVVAVQSTSPYSARRAFWCIDATMREVGFRTHPFHVHVPSLGEWGYVPAKTRPFDPPIALRSATRPRRYLNDALLASLFAFPEDMERPLPDDGESAPINRLNDQVLVRLYDEDWGALK
jgi:spermidine synthase